MDRFWNKVDKTPGCWLWTGSVAYGYGKFRDGRTVLAHRWAYESIRGPIPTGLVLDHLCKVKHCVNPDHLEAVTHAVNVRRAATGGVGSRAPKSGRARDAEGHFTHCPNGHPMSGDNLYVRPNGARSCKRCSADLQAHRYRAIRDSPGTTQCTQ